MAENQAAEEPATKRIEDGTFYSPKALIYLKLISIRQLNRPLQYDCSRKCGAPHSKIPALIPLRR